MNFSPRIYEDIVRDVLTTLTKGTVRETLIVSELDGNIVLDPLKNRPVRRISFLEEYRKDEKGKIIKIRFTPADFELVASGLDGEEKDTIRFRDGKKSPMVGSSLFVNYYPVETSKSVLTDINVGSVTRTLMETFSAELTLVEHTMDHIYKSAFLETAEGNALDKVVALVGINRLPAGHPTVKVRFDRALGSGGRITIPSGTALTNETGLRYKTLRALVLEPHEIFREVVAGGESTGTLPVLENELNRLETLIAGVSGVTNPQPSSTLTAPETDDELRNRASKALHGVMRGTFDAIKYGLLSMEGVKSVTITEFPNGIAGEIMVNVAYSDDSPEVREQVTARIRELRPAGVRVLQGEATKKTVDIHAGFTLGGSGVDESTLDSIKSSVEMSLENYLLNIAPGGTARQAKMTSLIMTDERIVDASISLIIDSTEETQYTLGDNEVFDVVLPVVFTDISTEDGGDAVSLTSNASIFVPLFLQPGTSEADAMTTIDSAYNSFLQLASSTATLTVDALVAAIRDDTRYVILREETTLTVEVDGTFQQLSDGLGEYVPLGGETIQKGDVALDIREGSI